MGPPISRRLSKKEVEESFESKNFEVLDEFDLGENFYCLIFGL